MSSKSEEKNIKNISQVKLQLQNAINNIKELEVLKEGKNTHAIQIESIQVQTNGILEELEKLPILKLLNKIQKRKIKRKNYKLKRKNKQNIINKAITNTKALQNVTTAATSSIASTTTAAAIEAPAIKQHYQLRNCYNAQRFLRQFELLKMLHMTRSQDADSTNSFAAKFNNLRTIWNSFLQENTTQRTKECKIEDQWNEVLFGAKEKSYYAGEQKLQDFLRIRRTWDSYLTRSKPGSSIPVGWVLPRENATVAWLEYRSE